MPIRTKPCEFCEEDKWFTEDGNNTTGHQLAIEIYPENNVIAISSFANHPDGESEELEYIIRMDFCPCCGRKLGW